MGKDQRRQGGEGAEGCQLGVGRFPVAQSTQGQELNLIDIDGGPPATGICTSHTIRKEATDSADLAERRGGE